MLKNNGSIPSSYRSMSSESVEVLVRAGATEDLDTIEAIIAQVVPVMNAEGNLQWNSTYPLRFHFQKDLDKKELWVACHNNKVLGVIVCSFETPEEYSALGSHWDVGIPSLVPHRMAVDPTAKRLGVAKTLLKFAETLAVSRGLDRIRVDTCTRNSATMSLFPQLGYTSMGEIQLHGKPPELWFMCFEKLLK